MFDYQTFDFPAQLHIISVPSTDKVELSDDVHQMIEKIWKEEKQRCGDRLFNGKVFSLISWNHDHLIGSFVDYKLYLAQLKEPSLRSLLNIQPLSISGLTRSGDRILFAQRSQTVLQNPLHYELAPSGGIDPSALVGDRIDILKQFILELHEETGLMQDAIQQIKPFALINDKVSKITEICAEIIIDPDAVQDIEHPVDEYIHFIWVSEKDLPRFVAEHQNEIVPLSQHLLQIKGFAV